MHQVAITNAVCQLGMHLLERYAAAHKPRQVPPETVATAMDQDWKNKKQPVAKYVKEVGKLQAKKNKGTSAYHIEENAPCHTMHYA